MARIALLSNPNSTGNRAALPRIRAYCATQPDVFHFEADGVGQIGEALAAIAKIKPNILVVNGGDGTVQAALTELYHGDQFQGSPPPVAVLPNGKTNLIALDLGSKGDPLVALECICEIAEGDVASHVVRRELIALSEGEHCNRPVLGMFLGGAGLADTILYCRTKVYPLGLPNGLSHFLAGVAVILAQMFNLRARFLPPRPNPVRVSLISDGKESQRFSFLIVTTLEKMLFGSQVEHEEKMGMKLLAVEQSAKALFKGLFAAIFGKLGSNQVEGVHVVHGDTIRIEGDKANVILDGETFSAEIDRPIVLRATAPVPFLRLAA